MVSLFLHKDQGFRFLKAKGRQVLGILQCDVALLTYLSLSDFRFRFFPASS